MLKQLKKTPKHFSTHTKTQPIPNNKVGATVVTWPAEISGTFTYKKYVSIPKMGYIDDLLDVNNCSKPIKEQQDFNVNEPNKRKFEENNDKSSRVHIQNKKDKCFKEKS